MTPAITSNGVTATPEQGHHTPERRGILFIISAPSGTGKTTLCKQLASTVPGIWHSVSYTTRQPRPGEENGREYFFIEEKIFQDMVAKNEFMEYAHVYGNWYGTPRKDLIFEGLRRQTTVFRCERAPQAVGIPSACRCPEGTSFRPAAPQQRTSRDRRTR